jgi:uncharacterized protein
VLPAHVSALRMLFLAFASFLAGLLNSVAGGGSFLSFPALLSLPSPPIEANATNTVALWPGQATSIAAYAGELSRHRRLLLPLAASAALGGAAGGLLLLSTSPGVFLHLVPWLLLSAAVLFALSGPLSRAMHARARGKRTLPESAQAELTQRPSLLPLFFAMVAVNVYIGYFGAGAGFLIMSLLALFGVENIHQINALKVVTTTIANLAAVVLFIAQGRVLWHFCLLMMLTGAAGGYLGGRGAQRVDARVMRAVVTVIGFGMAGYFFWRNRGL